MKNSLTKRAVPRTATASFAALSAGAETTLAQPSPIHPTPILPHTSRPLANPRWTILKNKIAAYAALPDDWDDEDGHAPTQTDIQNAHAALDGAKKHTDIPPRPGIAGDGEIILTWDLVNDGYFQLSLIGGSLVYITCCPRGNKFRGEYPINEAGNIELTPELTDFMHRYLTPPYVN